MTSLIDVIFLLLLFFMLSSSFTRCAEVDFAPAGSGRAIATDRPVFLSLAPASLRLNGSEARLDTLPKSLANLREGDAALSVLVAPPRGRRLARLFRRRLARGGARAGAHRPRPRSASCHACRPEPRIAQSRGAKPGRKAS